MRQWRLLRALASSHLGRSVEELARETNVSTKTIRRDLNTFRQVGFPLQQATAPHGKRLWKLLPGNQVPELRFPYDQALALYLGRRFFDPWMNTSLGQAAQAAFRTIRATLSDSARRYLERLGDAIHRTHRIPTGPARPELVDDLLLSIAERRIVMISYRSLSSTEAVSYEVHPYALVMHQHSLYLVANSRDHDEIRHFKLNRIEDVELTELKFNPPKFNVREHLADAFGVFQGDREVRVRVRFLAPVVRYVEESQWHASQRLTRHRDGTLTAEFRLSATEEIKRWVMSFGEYAEVLEPASLRREMVRELEGLLERYRRAETDGSPAAPKRPGRTAGTRRT